MPNTRMVSACSHNPGAGSVPSFLARRPGRCRLKSHCRAARITCGAISKRNALGRSGLALADAPQRTTPETITISTPRQLASNVNGSVNPAADAATDVHSYGHSPPSQLLHHNTSSHAASAPPSQHQPELSTPDDNPPPVDLPCTVTTRHPPPITAAEANLLLQQAHNLKWDSRAARYSHVAEVLRHVNLDGSNFDDLVDLLHALVRLHNKKPLKAVKAALFAALAADHKAAIAACSTQELCRLAWSLRRAACGDFALYHSVANSAQARISQFEPHQLSSFTWAMAKGGYHGHAFYSTVCRLVLQLLGRDGRQPWPTTVCVPLALALVRAKHYNNVALHALVHSALSYPLREPRPKDLVNLLLACTRSQRDMRRPQSPQTPDPIPALVDLLAPAVPSLSTQGLAMALWCMATLGVPADTPALHSALNELQARVSDSDALRRPVLRELSTAAWACGKLKIKHQALWQRLAGENLRSLLDTTNPGVDVVRCVLNLAWAAARLELYSEPFFQAMEAFMVGCMPQLSGATLALLIWSMARAGHRSDTLLAAVAARCCQLAPSMSVTDVATATLAMARVGFLHLGMAAALCRRALPEVPTLSVRQLAAMLWALSVVGYVDEKLVAAAVQRLNALPVEAVQHKARVQLYQAQTWMDGMYQSVVAPPQLLSRELMAECQRAFLKGAKSTSTSHFHREVMDVLKLLQVAAVEEYVTQGGLVVDATLRWRGRKVAVEVDGPSHFTSNKPFRPLGTSVAKHRSLELKGWRVLVVPWFEWTPLTDLEARCEYLRSGLQALIGDLNVSPPELLTPSIPLSQVATAVRVGGESSDGAATRQEAANLVLEEAGRLAQEVAAEGAASRRRGFTKSARGQGHGEEEEGDSHDGPGQEEWGRMRRGGRRSRRRRGGANRWHGGVGPDLATYGKAGAI